MSGVEGKFFMRGANKRSKSVSIVSLGCPKNLVDSEAMIGSLTAAGYRFSVEPDDVEWVLLNTCGFLASARSEAAECLEELLAAKRFGRIDHVAVCGCWIPAAEEPLAERYPEADLWIGPFDEPRLAELLSAFQAADSKAKSSVLYHEPKKHWEFHDDRRFLLTLPHTAYLKIADGCDRFCSYCAIPNIRGRFTSKPQSAILDEASRLSDAGVRELVLIAQETTFWGNDLYGRPRLAELLDRLRRRGAFDSIRVLYSYPLYFDDDLIDLFGFSRCTSGETPILPYIDLPLQHASERILRAMNRKVGRAQTEELLARLRERIDDLVIRSTFIVGFPGETDEDFNELVAFVKKWRFERAGVFLFSPEAGTRAAELPDRVTPATARRRYDRLYKQTQKAAEQFALSRVGSRFFVRIDRSGLDDEGNESSDFFIGRSWAESPDVDPVIYVAGENLHSGDGVWCEALAAQGCDLIAAADA